MFALFRAKQGAKTIFLTPAFHRYLDWFLNLLPSCNGITFIKKTEIPNLQTLHVGASLTGLGGVWNKTVKFYCDNQAVVQVVNTGKTMDEWLALAYLAYLGYI